MKPEAPSCCRGTPTGVLHDALCRCLVSCSAHGLQDVIAQRTTAAGQAQIIYACPAGERSQVPDPKREEAFSRAMAATDDMFGAGTAICSCGPHAFCSRMRSQLKVCLPLQTVIPQMRGEEHVNFI